MKVIDISEHQKTIDYERVKQCGINSVIIRIGWIGNNKYKIDDYFETNYKNAKAHGFKIGYYVYNYCTDTGRMKERIKWIKEMLKNRQIDLPVFIDMEDNSIIYAGKVHLTNVSLQFCNELKNDLGVETGVYANKTWFNNLVDVNQIINNNYKVWLAEWNGQSQPTVKYKVNLWQYTSKGQIPRNKWQCRYE